MWRYKCGAEEARAQLPELLERAHGGTPTLVTRHGKPYAAVVPVPEGRPAKKGPSFLSLRGSGAGLWGKEPRRRVAALRDEWE